MKKLLFLIVMFTMFLTQNMYAEKFKNADDLCYYVDRVITEPVGVGGCVDFGPFSGGVNCKKTIPIKNLSDEKLEVSNILLDINGFNGEFLAACGIDGKDETLSGCSYYLSLDKEDILPGIIGTGIKFYDMPDFTAKDEHSVYVWNLMKGAIDPLTMFGGDNLFAHYTKNGDNYAGRIKPCKRNFTHVDDLCYDRKAITYDSLAGGICMDFGPFKGGMGCTQTIPIRSISDKKLTAISLVLDQHGMNGSFLGDCGVDKRSAKITLLHPDRKPGCRDRKLFTFGPMGMMSRGVFYSHMPDYEPFKRHSIFTRSLMEMQGDPISFFTGKNMYVYYTKEGNEISGYIPECKRYKEPVPHLCYDYDSILHGLANPPLGACAKFGPFKGGAGCKQTIPIRSSSATTITDMDLMLDTHGMNGNFLDDCGVDDKSAKVKLLKPDRKPGCRSMDRFDFGPMGMFSKGILFDPMIDYEPYGRHTIYTSAAMSMGADIYTFLTGENIYVNYVTDGQFYSGKVPPCKKNFANDLCQDRPKFSGISFFPPAIIMSTKIKSLTPLPLRHVTLLEDAARFFNVFNYCQIEGKSRNKDCDLMSNVNIGFGSLFTHGILYDPMRDYNGYGKAYKIYRKLGLKDLFSSTNILATYLKENEWYSYDLKLCESVSTFSEATGVIDAWDTNRVGLNVDRQISTKIADVPFELNIANLNASGDKYEAKTIASQIHYDLFYFDVADNKHIIPDTHGSFDASKKTLFTDTFVVENAYKKVNVGFTLCTEHTGGNFNLHDESDCGAIINPKDCAAVPEGSATQWCRLYSSDEFAVRPQRFKLSLSPETTDTIFKAGKTYPYKITAVNPDGLTIVNTYSQSRENLAIGTKLFFSDGTEDNESKLHGTASFGSDDFNIVEGVSINNLGELYPVGLYFSDVARVELNVADLHWADIDAKDTPATCKNSQMFDGVIVAYGRYVCAEITKTFIPDHFTLENVRLFNHNQGRYTYLSTDLAMAAHIGLDIKAMSAIGQVTQNFREGAGYYENPVSVELSFPSNKHPDGVAETLHDISPAINLGFGSGGDSHGTHTIDWNEAKPEQTLLFNFTRDPATPVQPFTVNGTDVNITVTSVYGAETITGDAKAINSDNAYFHYVKATSTESSYVDITTESIKTPVSTLVYCPLATIECTANAVKTTGDGETGINDWWFSTGHITTLNYGNISLHITDTSVGTASIQPSPTVAITAKGLNDNVSIKHESGDLPQTVRVKFNPVGTDSWMLSPNTGFDVTFITAPKWAGQGKTGNVVDGEGHKRRGNRLNW